MIIGYFDKDVSVFKTCTEITTRCYVTIGKHLLIDYTKMSSSNDCVTISKGEPVMYRIGHQNGTNTTTYTLGIWRMQYLNISQPFCETTVRMASGWNTYSFQTNALFDNVYVHSTGDWSTSLLTGAYFMEASNQCPLKDPHLPWYEPLKDYMPYAQVFDQNGNYVPQPHVDAVARKFGCFMCSLMFVPDRSTIDNVFKVTSTRPEIIVKGFSGTYYMSTVGETSGDFNYVSYWMSEENVTDIVGQYIHVISYGTGAKLGVSHNQPITTITNAFSTGKVIPNSLYEFYPYSSDQSGWVMSGIYSNNSCIQPNCPTWINGLTTLSNYMYVNVSENFPMSSCNYTGPTSSQVYYDKYKYRSPDWTVQSYGDNNTFMDHPLAIQIVGQGSGVDISIANHATPPFWVILSNMITEEQTFEVALGEPMPLVSNVTYSTYDCYKSMTTVLWIVETSRTLKFVKLDDDALPCDDENAPAGDIDKVNCTMSKQSGNMCVYSYLNGTYYGTDKYDYMSCFQVKSTCTLPSTGASTSPTNNSTFIGIVAGVCGGVALVAIVAGIVIYLRYRRQSNLGKQENAPNSDEMVMND